MASTRRTEHGLGGFIGRFRHKSCVSPFLLDRGVFFPHSRLPLANPFDRLSLTIYRLCSYLFLLAATSLFVTQMRLGSNVSDFWRPSTLTLVRGGGIKVDFGCQRAVHLVVNGVIVADAVPVIYSGPHTCSTLVSRRKVSEPWDTLLLGLLLSPAVLRDLLTSIDWRGKPAERLDTFLIVTQLELHLAVVLLIRICTCILIPQRRQSARPSWHI